MSFLQKHERDALVAWVTEQNQPAFDTFLDTHLSVHIGHFSSILNNMFIISVAFVEWSCADPRRLKSFIDALVLHFPAHPSAITLAGLAPRLAVAPGHAWNVALARRVPIVNRSPLRAMLQSLMSPAPQDLILVNGARGSGRSHSWYLIDHVANESTCAKALKFDLKWMSLDDVFVSLVAALQLVGKVQQPSSIGATSSTVEQRNCSALRIALLASPLQSQVWIVFDNVDTAEESVRDFVGHFAGEVLEGQFPLCRVFLLGADSRLPLADAFQRARKESLSLFTPDEISQCARAINSLGTQPLPPAALDTCVANIHAAIAGMETCNAFRTTGELLVGLRDKVAA